MDRKKKVKIRKEDKGGDRFSQLPDEMIHHILSFSDARLAVQTSFLSRRWKFVWTTLPFLNFGRYSQTVPCNAFAEVKFIRNVFFGRNRQSQIKKLKLSVVHWGSRGIIELFRTHAICCNVESLQIDSVYCSEDPHKLSSYCSQSLKQLKLAMSLEFLIPLEPDMWSLPALTNLDLTCVSSVEYYKLPESYLICLSSLRTLRLDGIDLPESFSLLSLTTLWLARCNIPQGPCKLPELLTLELHDVVYPANMTDFFSALDSLQNLTLFFKQILIKDLLINCSQLMNLKITNATTRPCGNIMLFSPKICNFSAVGIFSIAFGVSQLENVYVKLREHSGYKFSEPSTKMKQYYRRFLLMFPGFSSAKILSLDLETIKALSAISDIVAQFGSPFCNLKYLKLPQGCNESICGSIKSYLLDGSPRATIVTKPPKAAEVAPSAPVGEEGDSQVRSSREDGDTGLWQGHEVNSEFIGLLDLIMKKYSKTFEHFTTNTESKMFCTMKLNMLCTSVNAFSKISANEVDDKMVTEYKVLFAELQKLGFNVNWLTSLLYSVEHGVLKSPLHELNAVDSQVEKMIPSWTASGTVGTELAVGNIGDYLFS